MNTLLHRSIYYQILSLPVLFLFFFSHAAFAKEFIVKVSSKSSFTSFSSMITTIGTYQIKDQHEKGQLILINYLDKENSNQEKITKELEQFMDIEYVVPNIKIHTLTSEPNDPKYAEQWSLKKVHAVGAWDYTHGTQDIVVAVTDTGVDWQHQDLAKQIWTNQSEIPNNGIDDDGNGYIDDTRGWDFFSNDNNPDDETSSRNPGHGTHCAGIIGAIGNNEIGVTGMAPIVSIMPIRFLGADGSGDLMGATKAIDYAVDNGAHIISASWGAAVARQQMKPVLEAISRANNKGVYFIAAAANNGSSNDLKEIYPANAGLPNVISVAASGPQDEKPSWSNYGRTKVDLAAPGLNILSTLPNNAYGNLSGTSMATPLVSGLISLMLSYAKKENKTYTPQEIKAILQQTGEKADIETACQCRVSAQGALKNIAENSLTMIPFALTLEPQANYKLKGRGGEEGYQFLSSDPSIASITQEGTLTAKEKGQVKITLQDQAKQSVVSDRFFVGKTENKNQCPLQNPIFCQILCAYDPTLPWCSSNMM